MRNNKGEVYVLICVFLLCIVTVFSVIFTYASAITTVRLQKTNTEVVFDSFVANNSILIFHNIKQGKNATEGLNTAPFYTALKHFCTLDENGGMYYAVDTDGTEKYHMTVPQIGYLETDTLELVVTFTMYVPIRFGGQAVTTATIPVRLSSVLQSKIQPETEVTL